MYPFAYLESSELFLISVLLPYNMLTENIEECTFTCKINSALGLSACHGEVLPSGTQSKLTPSYREIQFLNCT